jgi:hypothetical protein
MSNLDVLGIDPQLLTRSCHTLRNAYINKPSAMILAVVRLRSAVKWLNYRAFHECEYDLLNNKLTLTPIHSLHLTL